MTHKYRSLPQRFVQSGQAPSEQLRTNWGKKSWRTQKKTILGGKILKFLGAAKQKHTNQHNNEVCLSFGEEPTFHCSRCRNNTNQSICLVHFFPANRARHVEDIHCRRAMKEKLKPHDENLAMKLEAKTFWCWKFWLFFGSEFLHKKRT